MKHYYMTNTISIDYFTQNIPAPYSFHIHAELAPADSVAVSFTLTYTDREALEEDEILNEGFTGDDDINWSGSLPGVWNESLEELIKKTTWSGKADKLSRCKIKVTLPGDEAKYPANTGSWEYWLQELQQACIEAAKVEKPLEMDFVKGERKLSLKGSFEKREAFIEERLGGLVVNKKIPWEKLGKVLKQIYIAEYYPEDVQPNYNTKGDTFLNIGGGQWFNLSKANLHISKKKEWLTKLEAAFEDLITGPSA
ncbi:hypothetical protein [uncultured Imperialibacter sp.]|uniref:hypothetical protein n=1 Tax=uncultured Imperialibacter sp. TaxID=1672639 RepID=UPI0030DD41F0